MTYKNFLFNIQYHFINSGENETTGDHEDLQANISQLTMSRFGGTENSLMNISKVFSVTSKSSTIHNKRKYHKAFFVLMH